ncbi:hypothetical protein ACQPXH_19265 [Nocardia sp. CA-135953]|uniref:hypothetical protein n=1 Tax=Nocardia sp. CA-135953 TaxID=3239978 RepID=UPI003D960159
MSDGPEIVEQIVTRAGRELEEQQYQPSGVEGVEVTEKWGQFMQMALNGRLPDLGDVPEVDPQVRALAEDLAVIHLPDWLNPAGRKLAEPTTVQTQQAPRIAQYLIDRGWRHHPELETVRWRPTPGGPPGVYDQGLHIHPDEDGNWPDPDPEEFYDISDIQVTQLEDGTWAARHPRDLAFQASTKSEAYAGLVERIRAKIEEATNG